VHHHRVHTVKDTQEFELDLLLDRGKRAFEIISQNKNFLEGASDR